MLADRDLTSLEMFRAIAPEREPPAALVEAHAAEVQRLGRADDAVLEAAIDLERPIEKSVSSCESFIFAPPPSGSWTRQQGRNYLVNETWLPVGDSLSDWSHHTGNPVTFGACNRVKPAQFPIHSAMDVQVAIGHPGRRTSRLHGRRPPR
jgi:hypothetical protein